MARVANAVWRGVALRWTCLVDSTGVCLHWGEARAVSGDGGESAAEGPPDKAPGTSPTTFSWSF